jgi:hypothetical protein
MLLMFVVRHVFSQPERRRLELGALADTGEVPPELAASPDPVGFPVHDGVTTSRPDAAYRIARHEAGVDVMLFGTSTLEHLRANVHSILSAPPPADDLQLLDAFGHGIGLRTDRSVQRASGILTER